MLKIFVMLVLLSILSFKSIGEKLFDLDFDVDFSGKNISSLQIRVPPIDNILVKPKFDRELSRVSCSYFCLKSEHIACENSWSFSPRCSRRASLINLDYLVPLILHKHNKLRNNLAGGFTKFASAARMSTVRWHPELAVYAQLNVMNCKMKHDFCHNTKELQHSGQNLFTYKWYGSMKNLAYIITEMIDSWYAENQYTMQSQLDRFQTTIGLANKAIGHFTAIVNERNTHIGCGAVIDKQGKFNVMYVACNYANNNIFGRRIYEKGPAASKCSTGVNPLYKYLCSTKEIYQ